VTATTMVSKFRYSFLILAPLAMGMSLLPTAEVSAQVVGDATVSAQTEADQASAASQEQVNALVERAQDAAGKYGQTMAELDSLTRYNEQLQEQVTSQEAEMASIQNQLTEIEVTNREVLPLMERMVDYLESFVAADTPFLLDERTKRVAALRELMPRADVAISEKYRRILEAYQIELEYGSTLDSYEGVLSDANGERTVEFVRLGRVSLLYKTLDGGEAGYWNAENKGFVQDNTYVEAIEDALAVARQEGAPDLLRVPVPAPQESAQ